MSLIDGFYIIARQGAVSLFEAGNQLSAHCQNPQTTVAIAPLSGVMQSVPLRGTLHLENLTNHKTE